jgi:hypothetical protein
LFYLPGLENVIADFLSRPPPQTTRPVTATTAADPVYYEEMAAEQHRCLKTQRLLGRTSLKLAFCQTGAQCLAGDVSTGLFCPIVPLKFRKTIFDRFHNVACPRRLASRRIISSRFVWRGLSSDVTAQPAGVWPASRARSTTTHALWTVSDIRLWGGAQNLCVKHAILKSIFWQDAHICGDLHRIQLSAKNMFLTFFKNNLVSKSYV